ncbi:MAG: chloride channel protein [Verrucomicrobia bacterium]|nr:chloride channel protein [Verrucomicrobiota bacterium]MDE3098581.1 chloride channel protein [Verrucomicrobiota bacterium]
MAAVVGVLGGLVNVFFYYAGELVQKILMLSARDEVLNVQTFAAWQRVIVPSVGGLIAGGILYWGLRIVGRQGTSDLLEVVVAGDGRLPFRSQVIKTASALVSIATGASIGREGGIVHLAATVASKLGELAKWPPYRLRMLVGCGAAAGLAAAYSAPISGAVFASLIILGNFSMSLFAPLMCASVTAYITSHTFFDMKPWFEVPTFPDITVGELPSFILLGIFCGGVAAVFLRFLRAGTARFQKTAVPLYIKLMFAGMVTGVISIKFPYICGNGSDGVTHILMGGYDNDPAAMSDLGALFALKLAATVITFGVGTVGGVFTPTLFLGATTGGLFGVVIHALDPASTLPVGAFALVGMGATLAGTTKSPLLATIMALEISHDYSPLPAVMLACAVSVLVARQLHSESVYTEHLRQKGLPLARETERPGDATGKTVGDVMRDPVPPLLETATLREIAERFLANSNNFFPVVDAQKRLIGVVALQDLKQFLNSSHDVSGVIAYDLMRAVPRILTPGQQLIDALPIVLQSEIRNVPVVNSRLENRLVGTVSRAEVLSMFSEAIAEKSSPTGQ